MLNIFNKNQRELVLNSNSIFTFKNLRENNHFLHLTKQFVPATLVVSEGTYNNVTRIQRYYIMIDVKVKTEG